MAMELWDHTLRELFERGGAVMWPLLACSIVSVALVIDRAHAHVRARLNYAVFVQRVRALVRCGRLTDAAAFCAQRRSPIARVAEAYLRSIELDHQIRTTVVQREGAEALEAVEQRQRGLAVVGHIATLTGLLGTVAGLVGAFHQIELNAGQVEPADLAAGIWAALMTTVFGLTIAIPSYVAYHLFESRADRIARRMDFIVGHLDQWLEKHTGGDVAAPRVPDPPAPEAAGAQED